MAPILNQTTKKIYKVMVEVWKRRLEAERRDGDTVTSR